MTHGNLLDILIIVFAIFAYVCVLSRMYVSALCEPTHALLYCKADLCV